MKILKSIKNNIPNAITCLNLLCGALAVTVSQDPFSQTCVGMQGFQLAVLLIALAAVADFLDGMVARLIGAVSSIGKELDSLSDLVSFGLAPAMLLFNLLKASAPESILPYWALLIPIFGALRLARFNVDTNQATTFTGLPIPANAMFWVGYTWFLASLGTQPEAHFLSQSTAVIILILLLCYLMVSPLRMFSLKLHGFSLSEAWRQYVIIVAAILLVIFLGIPGLSVLIALYVLMSLADKFIKP